MDNIDTYQRKKRKELNRLKALSSKKDNNDNDDDDDNDDNDIDEVKGPKINTRKRGRDSTATNYEDDENVDTAATDTTFDPSKIPDIDQIKIAIKPMVLTTTTTSTTTT